MTICMMCNILLYTHVFLNFVSFINLALTSSHEMNSLCFPRLSAVWFSNQHRTNHCWLEEELRERSNHHFPYFLILSSFSPQSCLQQSWAVSLYFSLSPFCNIHVMKKKVGLPTILVTDSHLPLPHSCARSHTQQQFCHYRQSSQAAPTNRDISQWCPCPVQNHKLCTTNYSSPQVSTASRQGGELKAITSRKSTTYCCCPQA